MVVRQGVALVVDEKAAALSLIALVVDEENSLLGLSHGGAGVRLAPE